MGDGQDGRDDEQPSWSEMPTVVRRPKPRSATPIPLEHTVRIQPDRVERRALPFRKQQAGRRASDRERTSDTGEVRPAELGPALPFEAPAAAPPAADGGGWSAGGAIDKRDLPSSYAPPPVEPSPPARAPVPGRELNVIVAIAVVVVMVLLALALLASC